MAIYRYQNGYTPNSSSNASDYNVGTQLIQVWTNDISLTTQRERNQYFAEPHDEHCLNVEVDSQNGENVFVFFYDDEPIPGSCVTMPSNETLEQMLYG
jgi:hypothetical protein